MTDGAQRASPPDRPPEGHRNDWWLIAALITVLPLLFALTREMWEMPFPIHESVAILADAGVMADSSASSHSLLDPELTEFFDPTRRSWYRPLYWLTWYVFWHGTHSFETTLLLFRLLEVLTIALLVVGFIWQLEPRTFVEYASVTVAASILVGMPGFRDNLELPLPMTLIGMLLALTVWKLLERDYGAWHGPLLVLLVAVAVGYKEQGLVLVPLIVGAWWVGAPGVRSRTAVAITILTLAYLAMRFGTAGVWRPFEQDVGLGFQVIGATAAAERFGAFPYWIYLYNASATVANVLFSEPTNGVFRFVQGLVEGGLALWQIIQVVTSTAITGMLAWWAIRTWRREAYGSRSREFRLVVALCLAIAASGALGFNYARDRLGGMAVVFYALASYYALREIGFRLGKAGRLRLVAAGIALLLVTAGWQVRAIGTVDSVHARAYSSYREWLTSRRVERVAHSDDELWLRIFAALEPQGLTPVRERITTDEVWNEFLGTR